MAAPSRVPTGSNTPVLGRNDDFTMGRTGLPSGPCNYTVLHAGGPKCGCRRYTDKLELRGYGIDSSNKPGFCVCDHHSCYHNHDPVDGPRILTDNLVASGTPFASRMSTQLQVRSQEVGVPGGRDSLPDTLHWSHHVNQEASVGSLPAIPSQCLLPSGAESRTSSQTSNVKSLARGHGVSNHNSQLNSGSLGGPHPPKTITPGNEGRVQVCEDSSGRPYLQSLTEVATSSLHSSQHTDTAPLGNNISKVQNALQRIADNKSQPTAISRDDGDRSSRRASSDTDISSNKEDCIENLLPRIRTVVNRVADYPTKIENHEIRLDALENASFSHGTVDDNFDNMDTRVSELEGRMEEIEKAQAADGNSIISGHNLGSSIESSSTMGRLHYTRIEALEAQISELQAIQPTYSRPWEIEVVFIPFGSQLMGLWSLQHSLTQRSRERSSLGEDEALAQPNSMAAAQATLAAHDEAVAWDSSMNYLCNENDPWIMPKACGLHSQVEERLRSRGLVKLLQIKGPDARDVQAAMLAAFKDLPAVLAQDPYSNNNRNIQTIPSPLGSYIGLQASWVPLRKLHKDSRLRFLNTSEMISPALWTVQFLSSSVVMRAPGIRRLFVTQADSYIQHLGDQPVDWTWQKLRQLPRVYPESQSSSHTPEADAHEPCWEFDKRLDPPPSFHSSIESHHSSLSIRQIAYGAMEPISPSRSSSAVRSPVVSATTTPLIPQHGAPLKERQPSRPIRKRISSMPPLVPDKSFTQIGKRRIASMDHEDQPSSLTRAPPAFILKRRRISRSPSRHRDTPRWSLGPPSPYTFIDDLVERKTTPFAYATPHSNAPYIEGARPRSWEFVNDEDEEQGSTTDDLHLDEEGYDHNALSDYDSNHDDEGHQPSEEWQGVEDDDIYESRIMRKVVGGIGMDDDNASDASSQPSEYPSTQPQGRLVHHEAAFQIHIDEEADSMD